MQFCFDEGNVSHEFSEMSIHSLRTTRVGKNMLEDAGVFFSKLGQMNDFSLTKRKALQLIQEIYEFL